MISACYSRLLVPAAAVLFLSCTADSPSGPGASTPAQMQVASGDTQSAVLGTALAAPLAVRVTNAAGKGVGGVEVNWDVSEGGGSVDPGKSVTDMAGIATTRWTLGATLGAQSVTATSTGLSGVTFSATATPVPVATVSVSPAEPSLPMWTAVQLTATPRDAQGNALTDRPVRWLSSDTTVAMVSDSGVVTGTKEGKIIVMATSEGKTGLATVTVTAAPDTFPPRLAGFSITPSQIDVTSSGATVEFAFAVTDVGYGVIWASVNLRGPGDRELSCGNASPATGSRTNGIWKCTINFPQGAAAGIWTVAQVDVADPKSGAVRYGTQQLQAGGFPTEVVVINSGAPPQLPRLTAFSITPAAVDVSSAAATVEFAFSVSASLDVERVGIVIRPPGTMPVVSCGTSAPVSGTARVGIWKCSITIEKAAAAGDWAVSYLHMQEVGGAVRTYLDSEVAALGFPTTFSVTSPVQDASPPTLTGLSLSPAVVDLKNGSKQVEFTVTAVDDGTGFVWMSAYLRPPGSSSSGASCASSTRISGTPANGTFKCSIGISETSPTGDWEVPIVQVRDGVGNIRTYFMEHLKAAGFPTTVAVTR